MSDRMRERISSMAWGAAGGIALAALTLDDAHWWIWGPIMAIAVACGVFIP